MRERSSERSVSYWEGTASRPTHAPLRGDGEADVCVVGAGIAGMTTAYLLARAGKRVVVVDAHGLAAGETGQTTAHLASAQDDYYHLLEKIHGGDGARLVYESHHGAIERIGEIVRDEAIDCDFERLDGWLFLAPGEDPKLLEDERDAAHRAGFTDVALEARTPVAGLGDAPALRFPGQGQFHPLKYLRGLADAVERLGGRIHGGSHVSDVEGGARPRAVGEGFGVTADAVVVATNSPISDRVAIHAKQAPYRTFAIGAPVPAAAVPPGLYWDTLDPYHYVRLAPVEGRPGERMLIVGGEDHKTGHEDDAEARYARLRAWAAARFPIGEVAFRWSGQVWEPMDHVAHIGRDPAHENVYVATGDSGQGMTHGTIAGMLISDLVLGRENPWAELYEPSRKTISANSVREWARENLDVGMQYARWLAGAEAASADEIAPGTGAVLRRGTRYVAAYRADDGTLHERSAVCTHLGCRVRWNTEERSWDCPCHGSRFAPTGEVLTGPARAPLGPAGGDE